MSSTSFDRLAKVSASTKRQPPMVGQKRGAAVPHLEHLRCTPLDPAETEKARDVAFRLRQVLKSPFELLQTITEAKDIVEGDVLVVNDREYPIRAVSKWEWRGTSYYTLLVEDSK